jgi:hypothetical protein
VRRGTEHFDDPDRHRLSLLTSAAEPPSFPRDLRSLLKALDIVKLGRITKETED